jgi:hypothetical protein
LPPPHLSALSSFHHPVPPPSPTHPHRILAIDQGEIHFGICLAEYDGRLVRPLFLGTTAIEPRPLAEMVEPRAIARRMRRTAREHRRRLKRLRDLLGGQTGPLATQPAVVQVVAAFCKRRGHFYAEDAQEKDQAELGAAISHQEFQTALAHFLSTIIAGASRRAVVQCICVSVLEPQSRRPMRVDARKLGVCQWEGCLSRRAAAGVGSVLQGLAGKLRPFLEAGVLTREIVHAVAQAALEEAETGPATLMRRLEAALLQGFGLGERQDDKGKPLPPEKALAAWLDALSAPVLGERPADRTKRLEQAKLLARWHRPKRKESIRPGVLRDLTSARSLRTADTPSRSRFCPTHQQAYITAFLNGDRPPLSQRSQDVSRRLEILADKLTVYLTRRVLGNPPRPVHALVIESSAFDTLRMLRSRAAVRDQGDRAGKAPSRMSAAEEGKFYRLYWEGPQAEFPDMKAMLRTEFGGHCAYCGQPLGELFEDDHVLPRQRFPMEGYLVRVPTCTACNRAKGQRSLVSFGGGIHPEAVEAFSAYVAKKKVATSGAIHPILEVKKGLLQNLTREALQDRLVRYNGDVERTERSLHEMAGSWLIRTTATARHGRYLRQALATRLSIPMEQARAVSPRHAALLRDALTEAWHYDKKALKAAGDRVDNHALDAYVLALGALTGCFSHLAVLERFNRETEDRLTETVACADPTFRTLHRFNLDLLPVEGAEALTPGFRVMGGDGAGTESGASTGVRLVSITPPSPKRSRYDATLYALAGANRDQPARRISVAAFWEHLRAKQAQGREYLARLTHRQLRDRLQHAWDAKGLDEVGRVLVAWYKTTARGYDRPGPAVQHTSHPTIQTRWARISAFLQNPEATVHDIPAEFSLRVLQEGRGATTPLLRGPHQHHRMAASGIIAKVVGYREGATGTPDRTRPLVLSVQPDWSIVVDKKGGYRDLPDLPTDLAAPLAHDGTPYAPRVWRKRAALEAWLGMAGCREWHWLRAGSTLRRTDGSRAFVATLEKSPAVRYIGIGTVTRGLPFA